jgi:flagellar biogenesis protein FliO
MMGELIKSVIFITLLALGGYFFVLFRRKGWFFQSMIGGNRSSPDQLCVTERLSVGGRHYIAVIRCNGQKFLVGVSPTSITSLGELRPHQHRDQSHGGNSDHWKSDRLANGSDIPLQEALCPR